MRQWRPAFAGRLRLRARQTIIERAHDAGRPMPVTTGGNAMPDKRIERLEPALDAIIDISATIEDLADGFGGEQGPAEGPLWWKEGGYLLFSDIHNNRRMKYQPGSGAAQRA